MHFLCRACRAAYFPATLPGAGSGCVMENRRGGLYNRGESEGAKESYVMLSEAKHLQLSVF